jgi:hypothetical protein
MTRKHDAPTRPSITRGANRSVTEAEQAAVCFGLGNRRHDAASWARPQTEHAFIIIWL